MVTNIGRGRSSSGAGDTHVSAEVMKRLSRRELSGDELAAALRHIETCRECADHGLSREAVRSLRESFDEPERHLDAAEEMIPYVDGTIDAAGREIVESHLDDCAMCREEVEDLQRHASRSVSDHRQMWTMLAIAAAVAIVVTALLLPRRDVETPTPRPITTTPRVPPRPAPVETPRYANPEWARLVETMLAVGRLPVAKVSAEPPDVLRGGGTEAAALSPSGTVVESTRPLLTWPASRGASYVVSIFSGDKEIETSLALRKPRWRPDRALARGKTYVWQVEVLRDGTKTILPAPPAPPATFRVVSDEVYAELESARTAHPDDALLLTALYARAGLESEATEQLRRLEGSTDPRVKKLLAR